MTEYPKPDLDALDPDELRVRKSAAKAAVSASRGTGDVLPRWVYELAEQPVPDNATDDLQRRPGKEVFFL